MIRRKVQWGVTDGAMRDGADRDFGVGGDWSSSGDWSPGSVPDIDDVAIFGGTLDCRPGWLTVCWQWLRRNWWPRWW